MKLLQRATPISEFAEAIACARSGAGSTCSILQSYRWPVAETLRIACVQMTSRADKSANLEKAESLVARGAATGADVVLLPEKWDAIGDHEQLLAAADTL